MEKIFLKIFERFYRTGQFRSRGLGGMGLGLAIMRPVVGASLR